MWFCNLTVCRACKRYKWVSPSRFASYVSCSVQGHLGFSCCCCCSYDLFGTSLRILQSLCFMLPMRYAHKFCNIWKHGNVNGLKAIIECSVVQSSVRKRIVNARSRIGMRRMSASSNFEHTGNAISPYRAVAVLMCAALTAQSQSVFVGDSFLIWNSNAVHFISLNILHSRLLVEIQSIERKTIVVFFS